jgi:hypothetical protein
MSKFNPSEPYQWYQNAQSSYAEKIERIIEDIHFFNFSWKLTTDLVNAYQLDKDLKNDSNYKYLKNLRQIELIKYYPNDIRLVRDLEYQEEIYSIELIRPINGHTNAAHIPKIVLDAYMVSLEAWS